MNLTELAQYVCAKVGQTDDASLTQCKRFLDARLRLIWDSAAWRETLCLAEVTSPDNSRWLLLPEAIERVLKLRAAGGPTLAPLEAVAVFDYAPELFEAAGAPVAYTTLASVVQGPAASLADTLVTTQTDGATAPQDAGKRATIELEQADGRRVTETVVHDGSGFGFSQSGIFIVRLSKEITAGAYEAGFLDGSPLAGPIGAEATEFPRRPRLRLLRAPTHGGSYLALGKRRYPGLRQDWESPALSNVENALLAYATADMLERQRQYGKAQAKLAEAAAQMALLADLERNQSASETRLIPAP